MDDSLHQAIDLLTGPGQVLEVRALTDQFIHSGYFDDHEELVRQVSALDADPGVLGTYFTLNEVNPALLSRRANRVKMRLGKKDATTSDADILRRRWLPVDIDPVRPSGVSSSDEEHELALQKALAVADWLAELGFPDPVSADSGNGAHLLYRVDLPNDEESTALVKRCLEVLDLLFSDPLVAVDTANFNAARIWKLYGTVSRKGDNTPDRPHRKSRVIEAPPVVEVAGVDLLKDLASRVPVAPPEAKNEKSGFDLSRWLKDNGVPVGSVKPYQGGTLFSLAECPFSSDHRDGAFAIQFSTGAVYAGCHHASCGGGRQRWQELRAMFEPDRAKKRDQWEQQISSGKRRRARARVEEECYFDKVPAPLPAGLRSEAMDVLRNGDPLALMLAAFAQDHVGDEILARCMVLSVASQAVKNSDGLHVSVTGESGKGKTHAFRKMLRQVPDRLKVRGTVSNKALYYMNDLAPRSVLMSDDVELSDSIQEILKSATSNFDEPIPHTTVTKDLSCRVCYIPERCVWWIAKKEGTGDDQVMNRMLTCWIDESPEQDARVLAAKQRKEQQDPATLIHESPELRVCRAIWEVLNEQMFWVIIPFSDRIRFNSITNRRNPDIFYDLIKSHTALFFMQRRQKTLDDGTLCVYASEEDFAAANDVFTQLNGTAGGQESKLTKKEADLLAVVQQIDRSEFTIQDLQRLTGWSYSSIYRTIKGYDSRGKNYTGLLEKCPAISFTDRTVTVNEEEGVSVRRRTEAFAWDRDLYRFWVNGGACWLERGPVDDDHNDDNGSGAGGAAVASGPDDSLQQLQQVSSNFAANAATISGGLNGCNLPEEGDIEAISVQGNGELQQNQNYTDIDESGPDPLQCEYNSSPAANENQFPTKGPQSGSPGPGPGPFLSGTGTQIAANVQRPGPSAANDNKRRTVRASDYKPLNAPENGPCYACGKKEAWYVEKLTPERKARPRDQQGARRICRTCYREALRAEQEATQPLPGTIDLSGCSRVSTDLGRCSVCGLEKATWAGPANTGVRLCEYCYGRELRARSRSY
jgi:hypothetical protein